MTHRVGENAEARLTLSWKPSGTESEQGPLGRVHIGDPYIEVQLLRILGSGHRGGTQVVARWNASWRAPGSTPMTTQSS